jgi:hypothetical protein
MIEPLKGGNMNTHSASTGQYVVYKDYSNSAIGVSFDASSADPTSLASMIRNALLISFPDQSLDDIQPLEGSKIFEKLNAWDNFSDEELTILYAEAAEEDEELANLGLAHYSEILRQEEDIE